MHILNSWYMHILYCLFYPIWMHNMQNFLKPICDSHTTCLIGHAITFLTPVKGWLFSIHKNAPGPPWPGCRWPSQCWGFGYSVRAPRGEAHMFRCGSAGFRIYTVLYVLIPHAFVPIHSFRGSVTNVNFSPHPRESQHSSDVTWLRS